MKKCIYAIFKDGKLVSAKEEKLEAEQFIDKHIRITAMKEFGEKDWLYRMAEEERTQYRLHMKRRYSIKTFIESK